MSTIPVHAAGAADGRWHVARVASAPHRLGFFAAAVLMAATALWWTLALAARHAGWHWPWSVPPAAAHGLAMSLGFMPMFIVGFAFTAGPRWLGLPEVPAARLLFGVSGYAGGWLLALAGFAFEPRLAAAGMASAALAWTTLGLRFARLVRQSRAPDRLHAKAVLAAGSVGALAMALGAWSVGAGDATLARVAAQLALWGFLAPTFAIVSHRMIPFFTASALPLLDAWRPTWLLWAMLAALAASACGAIAALLWWPLPRAAHLALAALQWPAAALLLWLALRWGLVQSLRIRLLAMLHGGFLWFGLALALAGAENLRAFAWPGLPSLGLAPLHALTMGYLGATLIAMVTRVAAGHSGRPLAADNVAWTLYLVLQAATVLRVGAELWPQAAATLLMAAALCWSAACAGWAWRYGGWLGRPRVDGRAG
ncbi:NnrS family protein [Caldimonas sp. KR1-144]|uniref:NnrS family protein n=1 Tax=Caldimonas sp. KR1-144 TaxID=3400911 RepID=UPI003C09953D